MMIRVNDNEWYDHSEIASVRAVDDPPLRSVVTLKDGRVLTSERNAHNIINEMKGAEGPNLLFG